LFWVRLQEEGVSTRGIWEEQLELRNRWHRGGLRWAAISRFDADASGRLKLTLFGGHPYASGGRQSNWADRQSWTLESRLPHLFREIAERVVEAKRVSEERRIAAELAAQEERREAEEREWHRLMARAGERLVEADRVGRLRKQAAAWRKARQLNEYCDAMAAAHGDDPGTAEWVRWARGYAERLDPLAVAPQMPEAPEATVEALQRHLPKGWDARGTDRGRRDPWE
jgi:hypothetical protein